MPAARNAATAQSIALAISGEPVTRPPISSVRRRRFSSIGEAPMTCGRILTAASAQEASVAEQAWADEVLASGSVFTGGSWVYDGEATKQRPSKARGTEPSRVKPHLDGRRNSPS